MARITLIFVITGLSILSSVQGTVDLGIQIIPGSQCALGAISQPSSCKTCICGPFGLKLCSRICLTTTSRPGSGMRPPSTGSAMRPPSPSGMGPPSPSGMRPPSSSGMVQLTRYPILYPTTPVTNG